MIGCDDVAHAVLVARVAEAVDQADDEAFTPGADSGGRGLAHALLVERVADRSVGEDSLRDLEDAVAPNEWRRASPGEVHRLGGPDAGDLEQVAEAPGDDQAQSGALALQQRVETEGCAVDEVVDVADLYVDLGGQELFEPDPDARGRVVADGGGFVPDDGAPGLVEQREVGERPSDVDAEAIAHPATRCCRGLPWRASCPRGRIGRGRREHRVSAAREAFRARAPRRRPGRPRCERPCRSPPTAPRASA